MSLLADIDETDSRTFVERVLATLAFDEETRYIASLEAWERESGEYPQAASEDGEGEDGEGEADE